MTLKTLILLFIITVSSFTICAVTNQVNHSVIIIGKKNLTISGLNIVNGNITIINSSNIVIENNMIYNSIYFGIFVYNSTNITIEHNVISNSYYDGISIRKSSSVIIKYNIISNDTNGNGISIWDNSKNVIISNNLLSNDDYGIFILMSSIVNIYNNTLFKIYYYGIYLYQVSDIKVLNNSISFSDVGIETEYGNIILILSNIIKYDLVGVYIGDGLENFSLINNIIQNSRFFGILIKYYPEEFEYEENSFLNNTANLFYEYNSTLPKQQVIGAVPPTTTSEEINRTNYLYYFLVIVPVSLIIAYLLRRRRK
ncbi:hypothetical protein SJAV_18950 [Sulfurisphaera javensis]|uniref:Right handed beta helix domain-containing protein n=1 Tax=Sulfurisphaera javensis TaxID=2049879 RepID=A0AAT9GT41_9CREN